MNDGDREAIRLAVDNARGQGSEWGEPDPRLLNGGVRPAPPFPPHLFGRLGGYIVELAASKGAPPDYMALALIVGAAGAIGSAREISPRLGWVEPIALWGATVGEPSSAKTQPIQAVERAIQACERAEGAGFGDLHLRYEAEAVVAAEAEKKWRLDVKQALTKGDAAPERPSSAIVPVEPQAPRILAGDATVEALNRLMARNPRGLIVVRDELGGLIGNFGKYGGDGDAALYLSAFNGVATRLDRVKEGGSIAPGRALLSLLGGIQPERLHELLFANRANDGMVSRLLVVWPDTSPPRWSVPAGDEARLQRIFHRLRGLKMVQGDKGPAPLRLCLTPEAAENFGRWYEDNGRRAQTDSGLLSDFRGKGRGMTARVALVLEHLEWADACGDDYPMDVGLGAVGAAIELFENYLVPMAARVYGDISRSPDDRTASALLREIRKRKAPIVNARLIRREWRVPGLSSAEQVAKALDVLVDADCLRRAPTSGSAGRPTADYEVNPAVLSDVLKERERV